MARHFAQRSNRLATINTACVALACAAAFLARPGGAHAGFPPLFFTFNQLIDIGAGDDGEKPNGLAVGDFNGDFEPDIVCASDGEPRGFHLLMGQHGTPSFLDPVVVIVDPDAPSDNMAKSVLVADMNNDGKQDVVLARISAGVSISPGNGNGTFAPAVQVVMTDPVNGFLWPLRMATFELDGDGDLDLLVLNGRTGTLHVLRNDGNFAFTQVQTFPIAGGTRIVGADLDGDGLDEAIWTSSLGEVVIARNPGTGLLAPTPETVAVSTPTDDDVLWDLATMDIDLDGDLDLAAVSPAGPSTGWLSVLLNDGSGEMTTISYYTIPSFAPLGITSADFDGDQRIDLAVLDASGWVYFLRNETTIPGQLEFAQEFQIEAKGFVSLRIAVANIDNDCDYDLVVLNRVTGNVAVLTNISEQNGPCTTADLNYDGVIDGGDVAFLLSEWGKANSRADIDLGGRVEGHDLGFLLWAWQQPSPTG